MTQSIGIIGAGTMGRGIAQICASSGLSVTLCDIDQVQIDNAAKGIESGYARMVQRERMSEDECQAALARLNYTTSLEGLAGSDLTIEAATETPEVKLPLFEKIAAVVGEEAISFSNSRCFSIRLPKSNVASPASLWCCC